ncbi:conserved hypothetical protein, partial [Trichinella spiralis]
PQALPSGFA